MEVERLARDHMLDPADEPRLRDIGRGVQLHHKGTLHRQGPVVCTVQFHRASCYGRIWCLPHLTTTSIGQQGSANRSEILQVRFKFASSSLQVHCGAAVPSADEEGRWSTTTTARGCPGGWTWSTSGSGGGPRYSTCGPKALRCCATWWHI